MKNNISAARMMYGKSHGIFTQEDAAHEFGVSMSTYQKWEQGVGRLNGEILSELADFYGVSIEYLLARTPDPSPLPRTSGPSDEVGELLRLYDSMNASGRLHLMVYARGLAATFPKGAS